MNFYWLYDLPNFLFGTLVIAAFLTYGVVGLYATRAWVRRLHKVDHSHNDIVSYFLASVTVFYGITLGLVAVGTWTTYDTVQTKVNHEAQVVGSLWRDVSAYPEPYRTILTDELRGYTREVIDHSWPEQRRGIIPMGSASFVDRFQISMQQYEPSTRGQSILHAEAFRQFNNLVEARRSRLDSITASIPAVLWRLVIAGALICITVTFFFDVRSFQMHMVMTLLMSGLLGLMIFLVATLDNPFRGKVSVPPDALERVYKQLMDNPNSLLNRPREMPLLPTDPARPVLSQR